MINIEKHTHSTHLRHIVKMLDFLSGNENMETTQVGKLGVVRNTLRWNHERYRGWPLQ